MIKITNLTAKIQNTEILKNISLEVLPGEIHALMGAKSSGKSSLIHTILGNPAIEVAKGSILFKSKSIINKTVNQRSNLGIYSVFQHPPIIEGLSNYELAKLMFKFHKKKFTEKTFNKKYKKLLLDLGLSSNHGSKMINDETMTLSECKKNELLLMMLINPSLILLDEIDTNIDNDELDLISKNLKIFLKNNNKSVIVVTNNKRFLNLIKPTNVNVMVNGSIKRKGTSKIIERIVDDVNT